MNFCKPYIINIKKLFSLLIYLLRKLAISLFFSFVFTTSFSQRISTTAFSADTVFQNIYKQYMGFVAGALNIYNGAEYTGSYPRTEGSPFWKATDLQKGTISYEGIIYTNIPMAYDLVVNEVVVKGYQQINIKLDGTKVDSFSLFNHSHVSVKADPANKNAIPDGLYDLLYDGSIKMYVKRSKVIKSFGPEKPYQFVAYDYYFLLKDNFYHQINSKNELLNVFKNESRSIKEFWKENKIKFKKDLEQAILQTVTWYAQSKK